MAFRKLEYPKKREYVANQILEAIQRGEFKVGDKLPSEQAMAESIGVSRPSIREVLAAFRIMGIIETINGVGTVVKKDRIDLLASGKSPQMSTPVGYEGNTFEVFEARKIIEPAVALYAIESITEEHIALIEEALERMVTAANKKDYGEYHETNKRFHFLIAAATQNSFLSQSVNALLHLFTDGDLGTEMRRRYLTDDSYIFDSIGVHRSIFDCLKRRDSTGLAKAFENHDRQVEKQLLGEW